MDSSSGGPSERLKADEQGEGRSVAGAQVDSKADSKGAAWGRPGTALGPVCASISPCCSKVSPPAGPVMMTATMVSGGKTGGSADQRAEDGCAGRGGPGQEPLPFGTQAA